VGVEGAVGVDVACQGHEVLIPARAGTRTWMARKDRLQEYRSKRDPRRTPEPTGERAGGGDRPRFVIQQHDASSMHWDFRLEAGGVLKSWSVPKGPSTDPRDKRLAVPTEDHPLDYADFEGTIPEGEYGAGAVIVWDTGPYRNLTTDDGDEVDVEDAVAGGHVKVWLDGRKLTGGYALTKMGGRRREWLLVKLDDDEADRRRKPTRTQPESVLSGRTVKDVAEGR
jgi:DNA ligase D-like protein (predicted 3'-phosphoesterase)